MGEYKVGGVKVSYGGLAAMTDRVALEHALSRIGLASRTPRVCKLRECIRFALTDVTAKRMGVLLNGSEGDKRVSRLVRPLKGGIGYSVQLETADREGSEYQQKLAVSTEMQNGREVLVFDPPSHPLVGEIVMEIFKVKGSVPRSKLQNMLKNICLQNLGGVPEFDGGKPYYIPAAQEEWARKLKEALREADSKNRVYVTTPIIDGDLLEQVLDGLQKKMSDTLDKIDSDIDKGTGERGLRNRENDAVAALEEIQGYKKALGINTVELEEKMKAAQKRVALAAMEAEAAKNTPDPTSNVEPLFGSAFNPFA